MNYEEGMTEAEKIKAKVETVIDGDDSHAVVFACSHILLQAMQNVAENYPRHAAALCLRLGARFAELSQRYATLATIAAGGKQ